MFNCAELCFTLSCIDIVEDFRSSSKNKVKWQRIKKIYVNYKMRTRDALWNICRPSQTEILTQVWEAGVEFIVQISGQKMKAELHLRWEQESGQDRGEAVTCLSIGTKVNVAMLPIVTPRSYRILSWGKVSSGMLLIAIFTRPSYFGKSFLCHVAN